MLVTIARGVLGIGLAWVFVKVLKRTFGKSSFDNLPGPPGGSFLAGKLYELSLAFHFAHDYA